MRRPSFDGARRGLLGPLRRHWIFIVCATVFAVGAAIAYAATRKGVYRATASAAYSVTSDDFRVLGVTQAHAPTAPELASASAVNTIQPSMARKVKAALGTSESVASLIGHVTAQPSGNVVAIQAWGPSAADAQVLADAFARQGVGAMVAKVRTFYLAAYAAAHQSPDSRPLSRRRLARLRLVSGTLTPASAQRVPGVTPLVFGLLIGAACLLAAVVYAALSRWRRNGRRSRQPAGTRRVRGIAMPELTQIARWLFYAGCLLVGESRFRSVAGLTPAELLFIASFAVCILGVLRRREAVALPLGLLLAVGIFLVGAGVSSVGAASPTRSAVQTFHATYVLLLWPFVGAVVLRTRRHVIVAVTFWAVSAAIDGLGAVTQLAGLHLFGVVAEGSRMTGFTTHPNDLGGVAAVAFVPALTVAALWSREEPWPVRYLRPVPVLFVAVALVLSGSVASVAAAALAILIWLGSRSGRARILVAGVAICGVAVALVSAGQISSPLQRLSQVANPTAQSGGSAQDRLSVAAQAWARISRDPAIGTGLDTADSAVSIVSHGYAVPYQIHGLPLAAWYEVGALGLIGIASLLGVLLILALRFVRGAVGQDALVAYALLGSFAAFIVIALTQPMVFQQYGWIAPVFILAWSLREDTGRAIEDPSAGAPLAAPEAVPVG